AQDHGGHADHAHPVQPHRQRGVPPGEQDQRDEARTARAEGQGVEGERGRPDGDDAQEHREQEEDVLRGGDPGALGLEEEAHHHLLQHRNPGYRARDQLSEPAPGLREFGNDPVNHLSPPSNQSTLAGRLEKGPAARARGLRRGYEWTTDWRSAPRPASRGSALPAAAPPVARAAGAPAHAAPPRAAGGGAVGAGAATGNVMAGSMCVLATGMRTAGWSAALTWPYCGTRSGRPMRR